MGKFSSLFRNKSDKEELDETDSNPYARQSSNDTYSAAPSRFTSSPPSSLRPGNAPPSSFRPGSTAPPPYTSSSAYSSQNDSAFSDNKKRYDDISDSPANSSYGTYRPSPTTSKGYGSDRYGVQTGYGSNRYDDAAGYGGNNDIRAAPQRPGGYGGLDDREALFGDYQPQAQRDPRLEIPDNFEEMTQEEKDAFEADAKKGEIIHTIRETAASSARSRQRAAEGVERLVAMHGMLDRDEAVLNKVEQQLDESHHQARLAHAHLDNLDAANSSLLNFTANSKGKLAERAARKAQSDRMRQLDKDALREEQAQQKRELNGVLAQPGRPKLGFKNADRSKYIFEDNDGEQQQLNDRIDDDLTEIERSVSTMNMLANGMLVRTTAQVNQMERMGEKTVVAHQKIKRNDDHINRVYRS